MNIVCTMKQRETLSGSVSERAVQLVFFAVAALLFIASAALTVHWCNAMSMGEIPMPGGWSLSMTWMRMCGQTWTDVAISFITMWATMMVAMMLPSLAPTLWRYYQMAGQAIGMSHHIRLTQLTVIVGLGYFLMWTLLGVAILPIGIVLTSIVMQFPTLAGAVPTVTGSVAILAGALQFTAWKAHRLVCCQSVTQCHPLPSSVNTAWRHGLRSGFRLGFHCICCCAGLTAILLLVGVMDWRAMSIVATAISLERLAPAGQRVARIIGMVLVAAGALLIARAA